MQHNKVPKLIRASARAIKYARREAEFSIRDWVSREPYILKHGLRCGERVFLCTRVE
jgi:hypothetical protein